MQASRTSARPRMRASAAAAHPPKARASPPCIMRPRAAAMAYRWLETTAASCPKATASSTRCMRGSSLLPCCESGVIGLIYAEVRLRFIQEVQLPGKLRSGLEGDPKDLQVSKRSWISSWHVCPEQSGHLEKSSGKCRWEHPWSVGLDLDTQLSGSVGAGIVPSPSRFLVAGG